MSVVATDTIPKGHKLTLRSIALGDEIVKYGFSIWHATASIPPGAHVHSHNLATSLSGESACRYGHSTAAERNDEREIAIWKRGVTL